MCRCKRIYIFSFKVLFAFIFFGCSTNTQVNDQLELGLAPSNDPLEIDLEETETQIKEIKVELIPQNNCGGMAEIENGIEHSQAVQHTMDVGLGYGLSADGSVKIFGTGVSLGAEVAASLGYAYGTEEIVNRSITVKAAPGTNMEHKISFQEVYENGVATVSLENEIEIVPFSFRTDFKLEAVESVDRGCPASPAPVTPTPTPTPQPTLVPSVTPTATPTPEGMAFIPSGVFTMGTDLKDDDQYLPLQPVFLDAYRIDMMEVTNKEFADFVMRSSYEPIPSTNGYSFQFVDGLYKQLDGYTWHTPYGVGSNAEDFPNHPVVNVSWEDANAYCLDQNKRLPSEAEWEKAARGVDGLIYPWGNSFSIDDETMSEWVDIRTAKANFCDVNCEFHQKDDINFYDDGAIRTRHVGSYALGRSPYGVWDLSGNVWEWVNDTFADEYIPGPNEDGIVSNPIGGDETGSNKVIRGGSWDNTEPQLTTFFRRKHLRNHSFVKVGFRCAMDAE